MNLTQFICIFTLLSFFEISAQENLTFKDGKTYPATANWNFMCPNYALSGATIVQVAKTEKGGILKLGIETTNNNFFIGGTIYIYLSDFTAIACTDKNVREKTASGVTAYFYLNENEMARLKKLDIQSIRFNIRGSANQFSSQTGNFTAINKKSFFSTFEQKAQNIFETAKEITLLYQ